jgi:hypothetical protein
LKINDVFESIVKYYESKFKKIENIDLKEEYFYLISKYNCLYLTFLNNENKLVLKKKYDKDDNFEETQL